MQNFNFYNEKYFLESFKYYYIGWKIEATIVDSLSREERLRKRYFLVPLIGFTKASSISHNPFTPDLTFGQIIFTTSAFFLGATLAFFWRFFFPKVSTFLFLVVAEQASGATHMQRPFARRRD
jgi:hypothetical protein